MIARDDFAETPNGSIVQVVDFRLGVVVVFPDDSEGFLREEDLRPMRASVDNILAGSYDTDGIAAWWRRPRSVLDGLTPEQAWSSDPERVLELARRLDGASY